MGKLSFVHAGVDLTKKDWRKTSLRDFIWIRNHFMKENNTGKTIVFGHTITPMLHGDMQTTDLWIQDHKIGMDGGLYSEVIAWVVLTRKVFFKILNIRTTKDLGMESD